MSAGTVVLVEEEIAGSELVAATSIGAGTIQIDDTNDFTSEGGTLIIDPDGVPETKAWTAIDETTGIITLSGTLASAHAIGDRVYPQPYQIERFANVALEDQEELLVARVPHSLYDRVPVGLRDETLSEMELVELQKGVDGELVVRDVLEVEPTVDGTFIDVATLPPTPTDGSAPAASPTPTLQPGIGTIFVHWTPIANADFVTYEAHISTSSGFTPSGATLAEQTSGTQVVIRKMPDGSSLDSSGVTTYYVKMVAKDADGSAAAGTQASLAGPMQATTPEIAVGSITADQIAVNSVTADRLAATLLLANLIQTASEGQRVEMSPDGIRLYAPDNTELVSIPTDPTKSPTFRGDIVTGGLTVLGNMLMQGATNFMDKGAQLTLLSKLGDPNTAPTLGFEYDSDPLPSPMGDEVQIVGLDFDTNGNNTTTDTFLMVGYGKDANVNLYEVSSSRPMTLLRSAALFPAANMNNGTDLYGVCRLGNYIWVLYKSSAGGDIIVRAFDHGTFAGAGTTNVTTLAGMASINAAQGLGFGTDGTNLLLLGWASGSNGAAKRVVRLSVSGATPAFLDTFDFTGGRTRTSPSGLGGITGRDGTNYTTVTKFQSAGKNYSVFENFLQSTKALNTADGSVWTPDAVNLSSNNQSELWKGVAYDGTQYIGVGTFSAIMQRYTSWVWTPGSNSDKWWIGYTWFHAGPLESGVSPRSSVVLNGATGGIGRLGLATEVAMRGQFKVTFPQLPGDADSVKIYELPSSTAPATTAMKQQTPTSSVYGTPSGFAIVRAYSGAGAAPDTAHPFPGGNSIVAGDASAAVTATWQLKGDGTILLPRSTVAQRPGSPIEGDYRYNEDRSVPEYYDGATWRSAGFELRSIAVNIGSTNAHSSGSQVVTVTGLNVGDYCFWMGTSQGGAGVQFHHWTDSVCASAGQITLRYFNADTSIIDPGNVQHYFLIVRLT
jgi:hypothetical protein